MLNLHDTQTAQICYITTCAYGDHLNLVQITFGNIFQVHDYFSGETKTSPNLNFLKLRKIPEIIFNIQKSDVANEGSKRLVISRNGFPYLS